MRDGGGSAADAAAALLAHLVDACSRDGWAACVAMSVIAPAGERPEVGIHVAAVSALTRHPADLARLLRALGDELALRADSLAERLEGSP